ncbi:protease [Actinoplanes sp. SE50]|nr:Rhomboid family member 2 [Actinoplanes sp. SE50/110]ATO87549.1 protease [Actinoplanes sp. SE50]SLM04967.1 Rhomboid protease GluP [Actinoplanes sp. SE50/110]
MNEATVGHQCPDCVKEGRRGQRRALTAFGGDAAAGRAGYAVTGLVVVNCLVMVLSVAFGGLKSIAGSGGFMGLGGSGTRVTDALEVIGLAVYPDGAWHGVAHGEWYRLFTAMFVHYGVVHLLLNMMVLLQLGRYLEARLGPIRFLALYLLAGFGGNVACYLLTPQNQPSGGASTAVFGLIIGIIIVNRKLALDVRSLIPLLVVNVIFTFSIAGISKEGHLGGLLVGALATIALVYPAPPHRTVKQAIGWSVIFLALVVLAVWRTTQLT